MYVKNYTEIFRAFTIRSKSNFLCLFLSDLFKSMHTIVQSNWNCEESTKKYTQRVCLRSALYGCLSTYFEFGNFVISVVFILLLQIPVEKSHNVLKDAWTKVSLCFLSTLGSLSFHLYVGISPTVRTGPVKNEWLNLLLHSAVQDTGTYTEPTYQGAYQSSFMTLISVPLLTTVLTLPVLSCIIPS